MKNETLTHLSNELVEIVSQYECNCGTVNAEYGCPQCTRWMAAFSRADKELQSVAPEARRTVWMVENQTSSIVFGTREEAEHYRSRFGASVSGGMNILELAVLSLEPQGER